MPATIIETSDNRFFQVRECEAVELQHNWIGHEVKRQKNGEFTIKNPRAQLIRKAATRIVEAA